MKLDLSATESHSSPFPWKLTENPFGHSQLLASEFPALHEFGSSSIRMDGDMTYPNNNYLDLILRSQIYMELHRLVYSVDFIEAFLDAFRDDIHRALVDGDLLLNPFDMRIVSDPYETEIFELGASSALRPFLYPRLDLGYGGKGYGIQSGGSGIHVDNWPRLISILYYVNTPDSMTGGDFRGYSFDGASPVESFSVRPREGLMLSSLQVNEALHDVNPVSKIVGTRNAFYIAISCSLPVWKPGHPVLMSFTRTRCISSKSLKYRFNHALTRLRARFSLT